MSTPHDRNDPYGPPPEGGAAGRAGEQHGVQQYGSAPQYGSSPQYGAAPQYGGQQYGGQPAASPRNGLGIAALVCGILALVTFWTVIGGIVFGIAALVLGLMGRARAKRGEATNGGMSVVGLVLGLVGAALSIALIVAGVSVLNSEEGQSYQDCLRDAGSDQAAVQQCAEDFQRDIGG